MIKEAFTDSSSLVGCPVCNSELDPRFVFCNYDCYVDGINKINKSSYDNKKMLYPIIMKDRDFKHIPPRNSEKLRFDDNIKRWVAKKGDL